MVKAARGSNTMGSQSKDGRGGMPSTMASITNSAIQTRLCRRAARLWYRGSTFIGKPGPIRANITLSRTQYTDRLIASVRCWKGTNPANTKAAKWGMSE